MSVGFEVEKEIDMNVGHRVREAQFDRLMDAATVGFNWSQENVPSDTGNLRRTAFPPERREDGVVWGYTAPYAKPQEFGTDPYYPPLQPLLEWSERVTGDKGLGFYVAREKIPEEGIEAKHFARDGRERQRRWLASHSLGEFLDSER